MLQLPIHSLIPMLALKKGKGQPNLSRYLAPPQYPHTLFW